MTALPTVRRYLLRLSVTSLAVGAGAAAVVLANPSAGSVRAAKDPCVASEVARTVGRAVVATGDYLDGHPETNQVMTAALQQPPGPQTLSSLKTYFDANPKAGDDLAKITAPVKEVTDVCRLSVNLPQVLALLQIVQSQGGAAGGLLGGGGLPVGLPVAGSPPQGANQPVAIR